MGFFNLNAGNSRVFGLDLLRFFAIMFVVIGHSMIIFPPQYKLAIQGITLDGVAIFFVLSGFLIGGILIKMLEKNPPSFKLLLNFWNRRWLRTLPMYLVILIFLIVFTALVKPQRLPDDVYKYFFFLQNFDTPPPSFFGESWSLSIEEWFYLITPILLFGAILLFKMRVKTAFIWVISVVLVGVIVYRMIVFSDIESISRRDSHYILMQVTTRLDAIMYGVLGAFLAYYYPQFWQRMNRLSLVIIGLCLLYIMKVQLGVKYVVWTPALKSLAVLIMLPFMANWKTWKSPLSRVVTFISLISYSMYLVNLNVVIYFLIKYVLNGNPTGKHVIESDWPLEYAFFWVATISLSFLFYKFVEVPFMNLRKKEH